MEITRTTSPQINGNFPLPFFYGDYPIILLDNIYLLLYMYISWFTWIIFIHVFYVIQEIGGDKNSPDYLNVMVN